MVDLAARQCGAADCSASRSRRVLLLTVRGALDAHDEIEGERRRAHGANHFAQLATDAVAVDGADRDLAPDDEPNAARGRVEAGAATTCR